MRELHCVRVLRLVALWLVACILSVPSFAAVYEVGPGKPYATIGAIPAVSGGNLVAGDIVNIYPKAGNAPYYEKVALSNNGTSSDPITFQGIPDAQGNRPILDGTNAVQIGYAYNLDRGLIQTGSGQSGTGNYIIIQNLELRNAYTGLRYYRGSTSYSYGSNAAGVFVQNGDNVIIRNCWTHGNCNGIQTGAGITNLLIEACRVEGNGRVSSSQEHNFYVSAEPVTVQYCFIGGLRSGANGQNYKDRSSGTIFRYNWIEGGPNDQLDLVQGGTVPANAYVYGNVIIKNNEGGNGRMCLFGTDGSGNRSGTLYFMNNTFITTRSSGWTTVFQISDGNTVQAYNNIMYCPWGGWNILIQSGFGATCSNNWISPGYNPSGATMTNTISPMDNIPGFVNYAAKDFHLAAGSANINAGALTWPGQAIATAIYQPIQPMLYEPRLVDNNIDIGAYEGVALPPHVVAFSPVLGSVSHLAGPLTEMTITFDADVTISAGMVNVTGTNTGPQNTFVFDYNSSTRTATLQWPPAGLANDTYTVTVSDTVTSRGVALDGEIDKLSPALPSGNGTAGGPFIGVIYRLVGDVDGSLTVNVGDLQLMVSTWGLSNGQSGYLSRADLDGNNVVNVADLQILVANWAATIPSAE